MSVEREVCINSYQRYHGMVRGEKVDFVPRIPILMHFGAEYLGVSYAEFASQAQVMFDVNRRLVQDFDFDQLDIMSDPFRETSAFGGQITYMETSIPRCSCPLKESKELGLLQSPDPYKSIRLKTAVDCVGLYNRVRRSSVFDYRLGGRAGCGGGGLEGGRTVPARSF